MTTMQQNTSVGQILRRLTEAAEADQAHERAYVLWATAKERVVQIDRQIDALRDAKYEAMNALDAAWRSLSETPAAEVSAEDLRTELAAAARAASSCPACRAGGIRPPHDASPHCQSGARAHCSCAVCF